MTPERLQQIRRVFESVLSLTQERRSSFLSDVRRRDLELAEEVDTLLAAYDQTAGFIEPPFTLVRAAFSQVQPAHEAKTIGPYHLRELIGEGGMGEVWRAEQLTPVHRQVAVKLIRTGMDTRDVVARFEYERRALALMDHPAIARVFTAGSTPDGRPYLAMEYVSGKALTTYCDAHRLSLPERLKLFIRVCEGVQHAHQKALIHRDLKPSNILVTEVDGKAAPKIIDFGVARSAQQALVVESGLTRAGTILGTPDYMSPEQADFAGGDVDTRTDVYSLGVILCELIAGVRPFDFAKLSLAEIQRVLLETEAPRPSVRLRARDDLAALAEKRHTEPTALVRHIQGDLDAIVGKALEKDRTRRYGTPSELAADIGRSLRNEPVSARAPGIRYHAWKYVRRHRAAVAVAAVFVLVLILFGIAEAAQIRWITRERVRADRVTRFMTNMFRVSNPSESRGNQITARELLDKASSDIDTGLSQDPELQAQLMDTMGTVYENLGLYPRAESLLTRALQIRRQLSPDTAATAQAMTSLANALSSEGKTAEAGKLDEMSYSLRLRLLGPDHSDTLRSMNNLADDLVQRGQYPEAAALHRKVLETRRRLLGPQHPDTLVSLDNLGNTLGEEGHYTEAEVLEREAFTIRRTVLGADHPETLQACHHLADTLYDEGRSREAETLHRETLRASLKVLGPEHGSTLNEMVALANALDDEGRYTEALEFLRRALDVQTRVLGREHPNTLIAMNNMAELLGDQVRYEDAEKLHREVLAIRIRVLGPQHAHTLYSTSKLAWILILRGRYDEAEKLSNQARDGQTRVLGPNHPDTAETTYNLAVIAARRGQDTRSLALLRDAVEHGLKPRAILRLRKDPALQTLHGKPEYEALISHSGG